MQKKVGVAAREEKWKRYLQLLERAVGASYKPPSWRASEYVMTKAHAKRSVGDIAEQLKQTPDVAVLEYFGWKVLEGEIGRLYYNCNPQGQSRVRADLLELFEEIQTQCQRDPDIGWAVRRLDLMEEKKRKIHRLQAEINRLDSEINKL